MNRPVVLEARPVLLEIRLGPVLRGIEARRLRRQLPSCCGIGFVNSLIRSRLIRSRAPPSKRNSCHVLRTPKMSSERSQSEGYQNLSQMVGDSACYMDIGAAEL